MDKTIEQAKADLQAEEALLKAALRTKPTAQTLRELLSLEVRRLEVLHERERIEQTLSADEVVLRIKQRQAYVETMQQRIDAAEAAEAAARAELEAKLQPAPAPVKP